MTERLYLEDAYLREFRGRIVGARAAGEGGALVELDRTAFYPTAGGQLHDTGTLDEYPVREVLEDEDEGRILHHVAAGALGPPALEKLPVGRDVDGRIDWARRFDHMQQHTGQHLLSQAALRELKASTLAVHLGAERCTLDLDLSAFGAAEAARLEDAATQVIVADLPVHAHRVEESAIGEWGLRRPPKKSGVIRVVEIDGFDRSACGGTHVRSTGEIGAIAIIGWQRHKGGTRLEFLCGGRAVRDHRAKTALVGDLSRLLSAGPGELVEAVERLTLWEREQARRADALVERLAEAEAALRRSRVRLPAVIAEVLPERPADEVRALAAALTREGGVVALLAGGGGQLVFARSPDLGADAAALLRRVLDRFGGRGGGKPLLAQGTLPAGADLAAALDLAGRLAEETLPPRA